MPTYIATQQCYRDGLLFEVGDALVAISDPGPPFVLASVYEPPVAKPVAVERDPAFVLSSTEIDDRRTRQPGPDRKTRDKPIGASSPTRLEGRSPHERRY
ncbi:MAG: hypothetical protein LC121_17745 [Anaerolineae bacterium]|nr:hypothetical protein [Anaerolineae bacterium]